MRKLLIVEDDVGLQKQMRWCIDDCDVLLAGSGSEAETLLRRETPQVVTLDLGLPPDPGGTSEGFRLLELIQQQLPSTKVIVITGREEREHALTAIAHGAEDFYQKPIESDTLRFVIERAFKLADLEAENRRLASAVEHQPLDGLMAASPQMLKLCRQVERVAPTDATVLLLGETGTGKELIAQALHRLSARRDGPFVAINCAAIPENLLESELFGHEKGAFTGASSRKIGRIESASGGTLFLDEIGDMPLALQAKILRFLQERCIERIGGNQTHAVDVRVLSATHSPLADMCQAGSFREDLYFRLAEITLELPPLRDRTGDAVLIARHLVQRFADGRPLALASSAVAAIEAWHWPGNIREMENRIKRACIMADHAQISAGDLELDVDDADDEPLNLKSVRASAERQAVLRALQRSDQNISEAARLLGISRPTLYNLMDRFELGESRSETTTDD